MLLCNSVCLQMLWVMVAVVHYYHAVLLILCCTRMSSGKKLVNKLNNNGSLIHQLDALFVYFATTVLVGIHTTGTIYIWALQIHISIRHVNPSGGQWFCDHFHHFEKICYRSPDFGFSPNLIGQVFCVMFLWIQSFAKWSSLM